MAYSTDKAICLRVTDFSETSQIVALLTENAGLLHLLAKGSKRPNTTGSSKFSGPLDLLAAGEVLYIPPKSGNELGTLCGWQLTDQRNDIRKHLPSLYASYITAELTLALLQPLDPHPQAFAELEATLSLLSTTQRPRALLAYAKSLLVDAGYRPLLSHCATCGSGISGGQVFPYAPSAGGILCNACADLPEYRGLYSMKLSRVIAVALDRLDSPSVLVRTPPAQPGDIGSLKTAMELILFHIEFIAARALRTRPFIDQVFTKK